MTRPEPTTDAKLLFIYGTLKHGHCRSPMLANQQFRGTAHTTPDYRLVNCGQYPGLVRADRGNGRPITGELWEVDRQCLATLDAEEGVDVGLYERVTVDIDGAPSQVQAYLYLKDVAALADCGSSWTLEFERSLLEG